MRFTHHHNGSFLFDPRRDYRQRTSDKPDGLWLSVDGDWQRFLASNGWEDGDWESHFAQIGGPRWTHATDVEVDVDRCVLVDCITAFDAFTWTYAVPDDIGIGPRRRYIDWGRVADGYAGIIIAPYRWKRRLDERARWYYGWDAASACIWDLSAVAVRDDAVRSTGAPHQQACTTAHGRVEGDVDDYAVRVGLVPTLVRRRINARTGGAA